MAVLAAELELMSPASMGLGPGVFAGFAEALVLAALDQRPELQPESPNRQRLLIGLRTGSGKRVSS